MAIDPSFPNEHFALRRLLPGVALCVAVTLAALALEAIERATVGRAWLESLVLAILAGAVVRALWSPGQRWLPGIGFCAKTVLEIAIVLLGASVSAEMIATAGPKMVVGIALTVVVAIACSYGIGRAMRLRPRMALLVACGNSICGNSAIAAVAPVIDADSDDVAAAISFTAVLGVAVVLGLPLVGVALGLGVLQYGALAGLTVYAVPQVIAAAAPMGPLAVQMGALVKLVRVLMLGPVCVVMALLAPHLGEALNVRAEALPRRRVGLAQLVPWFIVGFLGLVVLRSADVVPHAMLLPIGKASTLFTVVAMAALGLGVDMRALRQAGGRATAAVVLSLATLGAISLALISFLHLA
jgi:uncharacterized integral membrane protein (TIGR00698 family)